MPYIGTQPLTGQFKKLDAISVVNGQAAYTLNYNGAAYKPATANALLVSVNGVIQAAGDAYTINGSTITFTENLVTGDVIDFIIALGDTGSAVTPVDGSVTTAKLGDDSVTKAKIGTTELDLATIKDSAGSNTAITIDSSGRVLKPQHIGFFANHDNTSTADGATFDSWDTPQFNAGSHFSTTTGKFIAPIAGLYFFGFTFLAPDGTDVYDVDLTLKSGATTTTMVRARDHTANSRHQTVSGTATFNLAVNDEVYLVNQSGASTAWIGFGGNYWMTFHGHFIG